MKKNSSIEKYAHATPELDVIAEEEEEAPVDEKNVNNINNNKNK